MGTEFVRLSSVLGNNNKKEKEQRSNKNHGLNQGIVLDTGSMFSIFKDEGLATNIRLAKSAMTIEMNAGRRVCTEQATMPGLGTVWLNENAITNISSFSELLQDH